MATCTIKKLVNTYVNGHTISSVTINVGSYSNNTEEVIYNASNLSGKTVVNIYGMLVQNDGSRVAANHYYSSASHSSVWQAANGNIYMEATPAGSGGMVVIEYY